MSYNTRRTSGGFAPSPNAVGQRRPPQQQSQAQAPQQSANYQQAPAVQNQQQQQPPVQAQRMQQQQQQPSQNAGYRTQPVQSQPPQQAPIQQQAPPPMQGIQGAGKMMVQSVTLKKEEPPQQAQPQPPQPQAPPSGQPMETDQEGQQSQGPQRRRPAWLTKTNKLPKRERQRRRNLRLRRMLQPKNALMILNELVKNTTFTVTELPLPIDGCQYEASVMVNDVEMKGIGRSKHAAKSAAAEVALRHLVKYKKINEIKAEEANGDTESMEVTEEDVNMPIPWQHIASFALYKLFSAWGEDPDKARQEFVTPKSFENKPPKPLPANAAEMNPVQLLNQMQHFVQYEEIGKSGTPPNFLFTMKCTVNGENYIGTGSNKKLAKKMAAYAACSKIYGIQYPTDVYSI